LANGFPQYKPSFKNEQLIKTLIPRQDLRTELLTLANGNHTRIMDILEPYNIVSMRYLLDLDLVAIDSARTKYFELLSIPEEEQNIERLTKQAKNAIKKIRTLIDVFK